MVKVVKSTYDEIIKHAESGYPEEVCGVLIGNNGLITKFKECRNLNRERARDRYELDPLSCGNWYKRYAYGNRQEA